MAKGLLPMKLLFYIIVFVVITFVLIMILNGMGLIAYNVTIPGMDEMKPMPGTTNAQLTISNTRVFVGPQEVTNGEIIKTNSFFPFRIEFDATMPEDSDYTSGDAISFYFEGYKKGVDFSDCRHTITIMPGNTAHISSDNCLSLKADWSGTVNIRIRAEDSKENAIASSYATFNSYMLMSSLESGSFCNIISNVKNYPLESLYIINDGFDQVLGKETVNGLSVLTINDAHCNGVTPLLILEAVGPLGKRCANVETYPSLLKNEKITLKPKIHIYRTDVNCDCMLDPVCESVKIASGNKITVIS